MKSITFFDPLLDTCLVRYPSDTPINSHAFCSAELRLETLKQRSKYCKSFCDVSENTKSILLESTRCWRARVGDGVGELLLTVESRLSYFCG